MVLLLLPTVTFAAVAELMDSEPLELHRREASLSTTEVAAGSWTVGKMPGQHATARTNDWGKSGDALGTSRRRNSNSLNAGHDAAAFRKAIHEPHKAALSIQAFAGAGETGSVSATHRRSNESPRKTRGVPSGKCVQTLHHGSCKLYCGFSMSVNWADQGLMGQYHCIGAHNVASASCTWTW